MRLEASRAGWGPGGWDKGSGAGGASLHRALCIDWTCGNMSAVHKEGRERGKRKMGEGEGEKSARLRGNPKTEKEKTTHEPNHDRNK